LLHYDVEWRPTKTAKFLAQKAVVLLEPECGTVVLPE